MNIYSGWKITYFNEGVIYRAENKYKVISITVEILKP